MAELVRGAYFADRAADLAAVLRGMKERSRLPSGLPRDLDDLGYLLRST